MDPNQLQGLAEALAAPAPGVAYVLIDAALCNDIRLRAPLGVDIAHLPLPGVLDDESISVLPTLMAWPGDAGLRDWLLRRTVLWAEDQYAATWLRSGLSLASLANRMGAGIAAVLDDGLEVMLRIADARVLGPMHDCLNPAQRARLFDGIESWWYLDREEQLQSLALATAGKTAPAPLPLVLTQKQLDELLEAAEPDSVMKVLRESFPGTLDRLTKTRRHAFVRGQIARAKLWGLERSADLASFCVLAGEKGEDFSDQPHWLTLRDQVRSGRMNWQQVLNQEEGR